MYSLIASDSCEWLESCSTLAQHGTAENWQGCQGKSGEFQVANRRDVCDGREGGYRRTFGEFVICRMTGTKAAVDRELKLYKSCAVSPTHAAGRRRCCVSAVLTGLRVDNSGSLDCNF